MKGWLNGFVRAMVAMAFAGTAWGGDGRMVQDGPEGRRWGSQRDLQVVANRCPEVFAAALGREVGEIEWLSPVADDEWAEYRDAEFLERLGVGDDLEHPLTDLWPRRGACWDGLARDLRTGEYLIIEAKAHVSELFGGGCKAGAKSRALIRKSLAETAASQGAEFTEEGWLGEAYQTGNRLAHLRFLREVRGVDARLVYVLFLNDAIAPEGECRADWEAAMERIEKDLLKLPEGYPLKEWKTVVFLDAPGE